MCETDFNLFDFIAQNRLEPKFEGFPRDIAKEKKIWETFLQPLIKRYKLYRYGDTLFEYEETKEPSVFSSDDLETMQRDVLFFTMELDRDAGNSPREKKEYYFLDNVLNILSKNIPNYAKGSLDPNIINLRDEFWEYLTVIFDSNSLPVFLEILSREPGALKASNPSNQEQGNDDLKIKEIEKPSNQSEELKIAIQVDNAVYNTPGGFDKKESHRANIEGWLNQNHPELSKNAKERISTLVNQNKNGGATTTN